MRDLIIIGAGDVGGFIAYHFAESTQYRIVGFLDEERKK